MAVRAMVTATTAHPGVSPVGIAVVVIVASWIVLLAVLLLYAAVVYQRRGRTQRQARTASLRPAPPRSGRLPAGLVALRREDPDFDEQLLLDAAQTAVLLVFAATTTGDVAPLNRLVTADFWRTPFGKITQLTARDRRRAAGRRQWHLPLEYYPSVPELTNVQAGRHQRIVVRLSFAELQAVVRPGAEDFAAGAAAPNFGAAMMSAGRAAGARTSGSPRDGVSWLASGGHYDLTFIRPPGLRTSPSAALADRTCVTCGATYRAELAVACEHCGTARALPWGDWRLDRAEPVA
jgi:hypothetical protein